MYRSASTAPTSRYHCFKADRFSNCNVLTKLLVACQIYNEKIYDLLAADAAATAAETKKQKESSGAITHRAGWNCVAPSKDAPTLPIRQKLDGTVFVDGLTSRNIQSRLEMLQAFREVQRRQSHA